MSIQNSVLDPQDYDELLKVFLANPEEEDIEREVKWREKFHLQYNINYYPWLIAAVERAKKMARPHENVILNRLKERFEQLNNVFPPGDLPSSIIDDERLRNYLGNPGIIRKQENWDRFTGYIEQIAENILRTNRLPFFEWCLGQLKLNLERHRATCEEPRCTADQAFERLIQFFGRKVEDITIDNPMIEPEMKAKEITKIRWMGTQRQLAELFAVLKKKGWIEKFEYDTIKECFTDSHSIQQYLKPGTNPETGEDTYPEVFKPGYNERFYAIKKL